MVESGNHETLHTDVLNRISDAIISFNGDLDCTFANQPAKRLLDAAEEMVRGQPIRDVFPESVDSLAEKNIRDANETGQEYTFEWHNETRDRWFEVSIYPDADGVTILFNDISERKARERELARKDRLLDALFEFAPVHIFVKDNKYRHLWMSSAIVDDPSRYIGKRDTEVDAGANDDFSAQSLADDRRVVEDEHRIIDKEEYNEELDRWFLTSKVPWFDEDGSVAGLLGYSVDITERKERERELKRKQEFLEQTQAVASVGGWELDTQTDTLRWTDEVYRIHGKPLDFEPTVEGAIGFYHPKDQSKIREAIGRATTEGESFDAELRLIRPDGEIRWTRARGEPRYDDEEIIGIRGTFQDITDRKEREKRLEESNEQLAQYEHIVETMDDAALIINQDRNIVYADNTALKQADLTTEQVDELTAIEVAERSFATQSAVDRYETALNALFQADGKAETQRLEVPIESVGDNRVVEYQLCPLYRDSRMVAVVVVARDITEREARLQELRQKTRAIEAAPIGIALTDPIRRNNPIVYVNDRFQEINGYSANQILGRSLRYFQGEETDAESASKLREAIDQRRQITVELRNYTKSGEIFWNRLSVAPVWDNDGELLNFVVFQQDVTEQKQQQAELQTKTEKLEILSRILRHDIKNDIQLIQGRGQQLQTKLSEPLQDELQQILQTANHINELTKSSKTLIETVTETELDTEITRLDTVLRDEINSANSRFSDVNISPEETFPPTAVMANETLSSVVRNLLNNAVQHNRDEVKVTVGIERDEDEIRIRIVDNGPGVPDEQKLEIFGKGEQGLESEGTGIGLYLVNELVQSYGGEVWVEDNDPKGAVFVVALPPAE